jgi:DNA-binding FrmR family transcriptional regulator
MIGETPSCPCSRPGDGVHAVTLDEERYCADVLVQIASVQEALRGAGRALLDNHLRHCATEAIRSSNPERAEAMYEELLDLVYRTR